MNQFGICIKLVWYKLSYIYCILSTKCNISALVHCVVYMLLSLTQEWFALSKMTAE